MNCRLQCTVMAAAVAVLFPAPALAGDGPDEGILVTLGTKVWVNEWSSWYTPTIGGQAEVVPIDSSTKVSLIPVVGLRYRDFYASFSTLLNTSYTLSGQALDAIDASRKEFDANLGYYLLPGLGVSLGFKSLSQVFGGARYRWTGPTLGATLTTPIQGGFAGYGALGIGLFRLQLPAADLNAPVNGSLNANYAIGEIGLAYGAAGIPTVAVTSTAVTLGYRFQSVVTNDYKVRAGSSANANGSTDLRDVTQGPALGFLLRF